MDYIAVPYEFAEKYIRFVKPEYIQVYLYAKYLFQKEGGFPEPENLAKELDASAGRIRFVLDFWVSQGEMVRSGDVYRFPDAAKGQPASPVQPAVKRQPSKPSYSMEEIDAAAAKNQSVSGLFYQAETVLNKVLTPADMEMLYSFVDWLGLPVEVITMLLSYAAKRGKTNRRYLETVAIDWAERGIDTFEAAEAHVRELESLENAERKIRGILGIYDRALTATEKKYISAWAGDDRIPFALIPLAYDRTVANTGKLSWSYMNKILENWAQQGFQTPKDVEGWDGKFREQKGGKKPVAKSKFNNYEDTNKVDYSKLEEQLLDMMLDEG